MNAKITLMMEARDFAPLFYLDLSSWIRSDSPFPGPLSSPITELQRKEELSEEEAQTSKQTNKKPNLRYWWCLILVNPMKNTAFSPGLGRSGTAGGDGGHRRAPFAVAGARGGCAALGPGVLLGRRRRHHLERLLGGAGGRRDGRGPR